MAVISDRNATGQSDEPRDGVTLSDQVPASTTGQEVTYEVDSDATIERIQIRIYEGAELDLQLEPIRRTTEGATPDQPLLEYAGKSYIDGDDDVYEFVVSEAIHNGEKIVIKATNNDGSNAYDYRVNVDVDYHGGSGRGPLSFLGGVL